MYLGTASCALIASPMAYEAAFIVQCFVLFIRRMHNTEDHTKFDAFGINNLATRALFRKIWEEVLKNSGQKRKLNSVVPCSGYMLIQESFLLCFS